MRVLVAGGTGETGLRVVERLIERGHCVRVLSRCAVRAHDVLPRGVEVYEGDVRQPSSLTGLQAGVDVAIVATGSRSYYGTNGGQAVDALGTKHLVEALARVQQLVLLSAFGLDRHSVFLSTFSLALNHYFHWKREAERAVRESGVPYTIVRPVELRNRPARGSALLNQERPLSLLRTVSRDTVADVLVRCCGEPSSMYKTFEVCETQGVTTGVVHQFLDMSIDTDRTFPSRTPLLGRP